MSTTPYPGPDEVIIPSRIYFDEGKRIDVKVWPKTIQLTGPTKDLNKVFKTLEEYDDWWHQFKKKNPDAFRKDAKYVKSINGLFLNSSGPNLDTFIPGNPWEHYCKYELHKHPFHTNEKEYNYFLDTFTSTDKYEQIMEIYANPR